MKKYIVTALAVVSSVCAIAGEKPTSGVMFDASKGVAGSVSMPNGKVVNYTAYKTLLCYKCGRLHLSVHECIRP